MKQVIFALPSTAALFGRFAAAIINCTFNELGMAILRLGRCVAIPKASGGVRPVVLSSFYLKFAGSCVYQDTVTNIKLANQYALNRPNGTHDVIHHVRFERQSGWAVVSIDSSDAFNKVRRVDLVKALYRKEGELQRQLNPAGNNNTQEEQQQQNPDGDDASQQQQQQGGGDDGAAADAPEEQVIPDDLSHMHKKIVDIIRYFEAAYGDGNQNVVYGPDGCTEFIDMVDGVKQGDSFSSFLFCLIQNEVNDIVSKKCPGAKVRIYIDDINISCEPRHAWYVARETTLALQKFGASVNLSKSSVLVNAALKDQLGAEPYGDYVPSEQDINDIYTETTNEWRASVDPDDLRDANTTADLIYKYVNGQERVERPTELRRQDAKHHKRERMPIDALDRQRKLESFIATNRLQFNHVVVTKINELRRSRSSLAQPCVEGLTLADTMRVFTEQEDEFVVLGGNISENFVSYNTKQSNRFTRLYDLMRQLPNLPQVLFTLTRVSSFNKPRFFGSVNPPEHTKGPLDNFTAGSSSFLEELLNIKVVGQSYCFLREGLGMPLYNNDNIQRLYEESRNAAVLSLPLQEVELVSHPSLRQKAAQPTQQRRNTLAANAATTTTNDEQEEESNEECNHNNNNNNNNDESPLHQNILLLDDDSQRVEATIAATRKKQEEELLRAHRAAQGNAPWILIQPRGHDIRLNAADFRIAMAIRCGTLPREMLDSSSRPQTCSCGTDISTPIRLITHALDCQQCGFHPTHRHNDLRAGIMRVLTRSGIYSRAEPRDFGTFYSDFNSKGIRRRADLIVELQQSLTTDFTVVKQHGERPGVAAAAAAAIKVKDHKRAVTAGGSTFIAFAAEAHGTIDSCVHHFIEHITQHLARHEAIEIKNEILLATANSLCRSRIHSVVAMVRCQSNHVFGHAEDDQGDAAFDDASNHIAA